MNDLILTLCLGVAAFVFAVALYVEIRSKLRHIEAEQKILNERVQKLEQAQVARLPINAMEKVEHVALELAVYRMDKQTEMDRLDNIIELTKQVRAPNKK